MDYILYLGSGFILERIKKILIDIFKSIEGTDVADSNEGLDISCNWFTLFLDTKSHGIGFASEDYAIDLRYQLWFEVLSSVEGSTEMMMYVIGRILEQIEGDVILLSNGGRLILERRNGQVTVDDTKLGGLERFPFNQLGIEYVEGELG